MEKRGLSDIVTTVLIILLVIIAIIILWMLLRPLIFEDVGDASQINVRLTLNRDLLCVNKPVGGNDVWKIRLPVQRSAGEGDLMGFDIVVESTKGEIKVFQFLDEDDKLSEGSSKNYELDQGSEDQDKKTIDFADIKKITVMPIVRTSKGTETMSNIREDYILTGYERKCETGETAVPTPKPRGGAGGGEETCQEAGLTCFVCSVGNCVDGRSDLDSSCESGKMCCRSCSGGGGGGTPSCASPNTCEASCPDNRKVTGTCGQGETCCKPDENVVTIDCACMELTNDNPAVKKTYQLNNCADKKLNVLNFNAIDQANPKRMKKQGNIYSCFFVKNNNIELDLNGVEVKYDDSGAMGFAVYGDTISDFTLKNGNISSFVHPIGDYGQVYFKVSSKLELANMVVKGTNNQNNGVVMYNVDNSKIDKSYFEKNSWAVAFTDDSDNNVISGNNFSSNKRGIYVSAQCENNMIKDNFILGKDAVSNEAAVLLGGPNSDNVVMNNTVYGHGSTSGGNPGSITLQVNANKNNIVNNTVIGAKYCALVIDSNSPNNFIYNNSFISTKFYGALISSKDNFIIGNNMSNSLKGIFLSGTGATKNNVSNNFFAGNSVAGIYLYNNVDDNGIFNNTLYKNVVGIHIKIGSDFNGISMNNITLSPTSVSVETSSSQNKFYQNSIFWSTYRDIVLTTLSKENEFKDTVIGFGKSDINQPSIDISADSEDNKFENIVYHSRLGDSITKPMIVCGAADVDNTFSTVDFSKISVTPPCYSGCGVCDHCGLSCP